MLVGLLLILFILHGSWYWKSCVRSICSCGIHLILSFHWCRIDMLDWFLANVHWRLLCRLFLLRAMMLISVAIIWGWWYVIDRLVWIQKCLMILIMWCVFWKDTKFVNMMPPKYSGAYTSALGHVCFSPNFRKYWIGGTYVLYHYSIYHPTFRASCLRANSA